MIEAREDEGILRLVLASPILSTHRLSALGDALAHAARRRLPVVLASDHPDVFLAGADLGEIARLDPRDAARYARAGRDVAAALLRHPAPTVAAVRGGCLGGGVDLALACDGIVAAPRAFFQHPGARRGLLTGWGGSAGWPAAAGRTAAAALLHGGRVSAEQGRRAGWVAQLSEHPVSIAVSVARSWAALDPSRLRLWRHLREGAFVDRFRACVVHTEGSQAADSARESP